MHTESQSVLLISMPFAGVEIPSIQLGALESCLTEREINIQTRHLYLRAAEIYGIKNYNFLIYPPNDSYLAQIAFSKYVFPNHWEENKDRIKDYYNTHILKQNTDVFSFDEYLQKTDFFYNWFFQNVNWQEFDIIGFSLNYGQFLPSISISKKIKKIDSNKKIVLGGSRTTGFLGKRILESFEYIDFIVSGEGEESLYQLAFDSGNYESIPNLIYKKENTVFFNENKNYLDMNFLPTPCYDSFYNELAACSSEIQQVYNYNARLPVEISRGCWWNKCTFCNLNIQHKKYREKKAEKIIDEINFLSDKYKILSFQIIGNILPLKDLGVLCEKLKQTGKDYNFFAEARADNLKSKDYKLLKEAGFRTIQTGIESFSRNYLKKMNKGARVIDNIAALKFCKEYNIQNKYNLIIGYPNEEDIDFEETKNNIKFVKQYFDPPKLCYLRVLFGSPIQCNPENYNIKELKFAEIDEITFPRDYLEKGFNFVYDYNTDNSVDFEKWKKLVEDWKNERESRTAQGLKTQMDADKYILYYINGQKFIKIIDKRIADNINIYNLDENERSVFLSCSDIISFVDLKENLSGISENDLKNILNSFEEVGIVFKENDSYLSLPLSYKHINNLSTENHPECMEILKEYN